jgi:hypothetical protein
MATSTIPQLRPLNLGELLDQAFRFYRRNFWRFIGIIAIFQVPLSLIQWGITEFNRNQITSTMFERNLSNPQEFTFPKGSLLALGLSLLSSLATVFLVSGLGTAAMTRAVSDAQFGRSGSILDAYRKIGKSWWTLVVALFFGVLLSIILVLWTIVPCVGWLSGIGMLFFFGMAVIPLLAPVIVIEGKGWVSSYRRAWDLIRRRFWWIIGFLLILSLLSQAIVTGPSLLIYSMFSYLFAGNVDKLLLASSLQALATLLLSVIWNPMQLTAYTLLYFDLRVRTEGLDLAIQASEAETNPQEVDTILRQAPEPQQDKLITGKEFLYFIGLSFGIVILYALLIGVIGGLGLGAGMLGGG